MIELTHLSLFTGIGGLDLAAEWAGFETVGQCEFADYQTKVLEKHWKGVVRWKDVKDITAKSFRERTGLKAPTLISGGFPCQPHSLAGKRQASSDERDLWGEFARIIRELKPQWVVGENVVGLLSSEHGRYFGRILRDLAEGGYHVGWYSFPASWAGALHRRERVFIVAYSARERRHSVEKKKQKEHTGEHLEKRKFQKAWEKIPHEEIDTLFLLSREIPEPSGRLERNDNGLSEGVDRLKCLGNAVVPQQAYPIFKEIAEVERNVNQTNYVGN